MSGSMVSEGIVLLGIVLAASMLSQVFITSMTNIQRSSIESSKYLSDRIKTSIKIIYASNSSSTVKIWVKNVGSLDIAPSDIQRANIFFGKDLSCYTYAETGIGWKYRILSGATSWLPDETLEVTLRPSSPLNAGQYYLSFVTHNGVKDEYTMSIGG
jgi:archaellum component FlaF (FlaF/FlaG flagellin family)